MQTSLFNDHRTINVAPILKREYYQMDEFELACAHRLASEKNDVLTCKEIEGYVSKLRPDQLKNIKGLKYYKPVQ